MFLRMFKADSRSVKKTEQPAALKLDRGTQPHKFSGLFAVQKSRVDYQGRPLTPTRKADRPVPDKPSASPKPGKTKTSTAMPEIHTTLTQMLAHLKDVAGTVEALNARIDAVEQVKAQVDKTLKSLAPVIGHIKGGDLVPVPGKVNTIKSEIDNIAHLLATATNHREVACLRQQLLIKSEELDAIEQSNVRKGIQEQARSSELQMLRGYLVGSGIECRRAFNATL